MQYNLNKFQKTLYYKKKYFDDYKLWIRNWQKSNIMTYNLTYNDLLNNTEKEISNIFKFLNINITKKVINELITLNSLSKMKNKSVQKEFFRDSCLFGECRCVVWNRSFSFRSRIFV